MTTLFLDINNEINIIRNFAYNITTESYKIDTEKLETWEKVSFSCPQESTKFAFIESLFKKPSCNEDCEHVPNDLNNWHFTEWTQ